MSIWYCHVAVGTPWLAVTCLYILAFSLSNPVCLHQYLTNTDVALHSPIFWMLRDDLHVGGVNTLEALLVSVSSGDPKHISPFMWP